MKRIISFIFDSHTFYFVLFYFLLAFVYFALITGYQKFCIGNTFFQILMSPIISSTPPCRQTFWLMTEVNSFTKNYWVAVSFFIASKAVSIMKMMNERINIKNEKNKIDLN